MLATLRNEGVELRREERSSKVEGVQGKSEVKTVDIRSDMDVRLPGERGFAARPGAHKPTISAPTANNVWTL